MTKLIRILITGFGSFPGAPYNPTPALVERLKKLRRPALAEVDIATHIFRVSYAAVDRDLPVLIAKHCPDALLMFGLATRTNYLRIETRARNAVTMLWPDAAQTRVRKGAIAGCADAMPFGLHAARLLHVAQATGIDARASRDAGSYLCNYLSWRAIETTNKDHRPHLAAFVHVPLISRDGRAWARLGSSITLDHLVDAGEAMLMEMVKSTRRMAMVS